MRRPVAMPEAAPSPGLERARAKLGQSPDDPRALLLAGRAELAAGDAHAASRFLERALRFTPSSPFALAPVHNALAQAYMAGGAHHEALSHLRASVALVAAQWQGWALLAEHHLISLRHADAIAALERCLEVEDSSLEGEERPARASLLTKLGVAELLRDLPAEASRHLGEALALGLGSEEERQLAERYLGMADRMVARPPR